MLWKTYLLGGLCLATVTACTQAGNPALNARAADREQTFVYRGNISAGACDDVGQLIPTENSPVRAEASAAPTR